MSFNFPNSPADGTTFAPAGGPTYVFSSGVWKLAGGGSSFVVSSDTAPASPFPGMLWFETDTGALFFWYVDADSSQWVQINFTPTSGLTAETRNRLVNPAMQISTENGTTAGSTSGYYAADNWYLITGVAGGGTHVGSLAMANQAPSLGPVYRLVATVVTADATVAAGDSWQIKQGVEGTRIADFNWGYSDALPVVLRFSCRSTAAGTFSVSIRDNPITASWVGQFTISAAEASNWVDRSFAIPAPPGLGTWTTDITNSFQLVFALAAGPTITGALGWQAGNFIGGPVQSTFFNTVNNVFNLSNVGLHLDPLGTGVAPPFQTPELEEERRNCQRYYWKNAIVVVDTAATYNTLFYPVYMCGAPAITGGGAGFTVANAISAACDIYQTTRAVQNLTFDSRL